MESVLHIEPITRQAPAPLMVGHTDHMFYGESLTHDDENVGDITSHMSLGAPLHALDDGSHSAHVPLVKTIEYMPDFSRNEGNVYLETTHYLHDKKFLVPFRTKLRSGIGTGMRLNHLPSLNYARGEISPALPQPVTDPRSEIVQDVALRDSIFERRNNKHLRDWLTHELCPMLDLRPYAPLSFDPDIINKMIPRYINQVRDTPSEFGPRDLKAISEIICPVHPRDERMIPASFQVGDPVIHHILDVRQKLVPNTFNFRSLGSIPVDTLDRIEYNPGKFQDICDLLDCIPLTDFNIDLVLNLDQEIVFYNEHLAINRFGMIADVDLGKYCAENVVRDYINGETLNEILDRFETFHQGINDEIRETIKYQMVKIKLIKTLSDEAAILLYRVDSAPDDPPMCGVYFDIALQSLAPISVIPVPVPN